MRPHPVDVSRSRSKSPSRIFRSTTPRSIMSYILQPRKIETTSLTKSDETQNTSTTCNTMLKPVPCKEKILTSFGLVEPKTPPGPPPFLLNKNVRPIKRLVIKKQNK
jgi:hypothetical protein